MAADPGLVDWVREAMEPIGTVTSRAMMGGAALYCDGMIFAFATSDGLWLKADAENAALFDAAGCAHVTYAMKGKQVDLSYRHAPADIYDDADALREWVGIALAAGMRAAARKPGRRRG